MHQLTPCDEIGRQTEMKQDTFDNSQDRTKDEPRAACLDTLK